MPDIQDVLEKINQIQRNVFIDYPCPDGTTERLVPCNGRDDIYVTGPMDEPAQAPWWTNHITIQTVLAPGQVSEHWSIEMYLYLGDAEDAGGDTSEIRRQGGFWLEAALERLSFHRNLDNAGGLQDFNIGSARVADETDIRSSDFDFRQPIFGIGVHLLCTASKVYPYAATFDLKLELDRTPIEIATINGSSELFTFSRVKFDIENVNDLGSVSTAGQRLIFDSAGDYGYLFGTGRELLRYDRRTADVDTPWSGRTSYTLRPSLADVGAAAWVESEGALVVIGRANSAVVQVDINPSTNAPAHAPNSVTARDDSENQLIHPMGYTVTAAVVHDGEFLVAYNAAGGESGRVYRVKLTTRTDDDGNTHLGVEYGDDIRILPWGGLLSLASYQDELIALRQWQYTEGGATKYALTLLNLDALPVYTPPMMMGQGD